MATTFVFEEAVKFNAKGRIALTGPGGSGKSLTMLRIARLLAGSEGKIAAVDTEQGSLSKYAVTKANPVANNVHTFKFNTLKLQSYSHENFVGALTAAEEAGFDVFCCDSLSHFWMGKDGALEFVDEKKKRAAGRNGDQMEGWKEFRPHERAMIDRMIASPCHVIVTMRTKNEYKDEEYTNAQGHRKTKRVKIGLAPVQREGLDYEFDFVGLMTDENEMIVEKTRCPSYSGKVLSKPAAKDFVAFQEWLMGDEAPAVAAQPRPTLPTAKAEPPKPATEPQWNHEAAVPGFAELREEMGSIRFLELLDQFSGNGAKQVSDLRGREHAKEVYTKIFAKLSPGVKEKLAKRQAPPEASSIPAALQAIFTQIAGGLGAQCKAFEQLKKDLAETFPEQEAADLYYAALKNQGVEHANQFKSHKAARLAATMLFEAIANAQKGRAA